MYKYILFDINTLITLMKTKKILINSLEESIKLLRKQSNFEIYNLIKENILIYPYETLYFLIYKLTEVIGTCRLIFKSRSNKIRNALNLLKLLIIKKNNNDYFLNLMKYKI